MEEESLGIGLFQKKEEEERALALETEVLRLEEESRKKEEEEEKLAEEVRKGILEKESLGKRVEYKKLSEELEKARFRYENAKKWFQNALKAGEKDAEIELKKLENKGK